MRIVDHATQASEEWRPGVMTRMHVSAVMGSVQLCVFQQWCDPGKGAPTHLHAVEEVLTVLDGQAEIWIEDERATLHQLEKIDRGTVARKEYSECRVGEDAVLTRCSFTCPRQGYRAA